MEAYLLLAKQASGRALILLIQEVISHPAIFSFDRLLVTPHVQQLSASQDPEEQAYVKLLTIFSTGTYSDYLQRQSALPSVSRTDLDKLRKLTLVSMAAKSHVLPYPMAMQELGVESVRKLEDLVVEAIYASLLTAKLNTREQHIYVQSTIGRDMDAGSLDSMLSSLNALSDRCDVALNDLAASMAQAQNTIRAKQAHNQEHNLALEDMRLHLEHQNQAQLGSSTPRSRRVNFQTSKLDSLMDSPIEELEDPVTFNLSNRKRKTPSEVRRDMI